MSPPALPSRRFALVFTLVLLITIQPLAASTAQDAALRSPTPLGLHGLDLIRALRASGGEDMRISYHSQTGKVRFIGAAPQHVIAQPGGLGNNASPAAAARGFLAVYGELFGLKDQSQELTLMKASATPDGRAFVRFQQVYRGIPIVGGELIVQLDARHAVLSASGEVLPGLDLDVTPVIGAEMARQNALVKVARDYGLDVRQLTTSQPELWIYDPAILGGPGPRFSSLVWRIEVASLEMAPIRELVLIDTRLGAVALHFNQVDTALNRTTHTANNGTTLPGTLVCNESNPTCSGGDSHAVAAHDYAGDTYNYYMTEHGRDSIDDAGMTLVSTVHYGNNYANAFWNGTQMVYGDAYGFPLADDVVAHELTHGVTENESGLFYFYQSGAINESLSDVWGEFVDQTNGSGTDTAGVKWQVGEDVTGLGAIRNMKDPTLFGDPDRMTSANYYCEQSSLSSGAGDNGGVHINSGVNNKAVYLMTDGATFNGYTVTGLGVTKVADLYYLVQTQLLTSAADYADLYDALIQAGISLGYSAADRQEIADALNAVEMNQQPASCAATDAPVCDSGSPVNLFFDDIESGSGNWTVGSIAGTAYWFVPQTTETLGLGGPYATSGVGNIWGFDQDTTSNTYLAMNSSLTLPANAYLHFNHSFGFESSSAGTSRYDGGIVEYSTNGGSTWSNAGALFTHNGYNGTLAAGNPLGAIAAFSADSRGYISSRLNLNSLAGQSVRIRFRIGTDSSVYDFGWFIDDVRIYTCTTGPTAPTVSGLPDQSLNINTTRNNAIDLWAYTSDAQSPDNQLTFSIDNTPDPAAGVTLDSNRYIDINPTADWTGQTSVTIRATDPGALSGTDTFLVTVSQQTLIYLPLVLRNWPPIVAHTYIASTDDTTLRTNSASTWYGNFTDFAVGYSTASQANTGVARAILRFNLSTIPAGTAITSATLQIYNVFSIWSSGQSNNMLITAYRINQNWPASPTWDNFANAFAESHAATTVGGNFGFYNFNVQSLVQGWLNGSWPNYGIMLRGQEGGYINLKGFASANSSPSYQPRLIVSYPDASGTIVTLAIPAEPVNDGSMFGDREVTSDDGVSYRRLR